MDTIYEVVIVGTGPAGLTAGLYTSRARRSTLILEKETIGGELMNRDLIENYPGYPEGILGPELGSNMMTQVMNGGAEIRLGEVNQIRIEKDYKILRTPEEDYFGKAIIMAGGAYPKKLGVPGEEEFVDKGIFYCATCDGPHFSDKVVVVAGGGNSGITEALYLTRFASKIILIEMMPQLTATRILQERAFSNSKIEIRCGTKIEAIVGDDQVRGLDLLDLGRGEKSEVQADGVLVHIGLEPNTDYLNGIVLLDGRRQIVVNEKMETGIAGVFAVGDIRHHSPMQIATAVGDGATAALSVERYLYSS